MEKEQGVFTGSSCFTMEWTEKGVGGILEEEFAKNVRMSQKLEVEVVTLKFISGSGPRAGNSGKRCMRSSRVSLEVRD